jgi:hypothetical protein
LVALITEVLDFGACIDDARAGLADKPHEIRHYGFMHCPAEAKTRIVPEQAMLAEGRRVDFRPESNSRRHDCRVIETVPQAASVRQDQPLVGVDIEDPVAAGCGQPFVASPREIAAPRAFEQDYVIAPGDIERVISRTGVDDDNLVNPTGNGREAAVKELFFVADDQRR